MTDHLTLAQAEIYRTYGHWVRFGRKSIRKYGTNSAVDSAEVAVTPFGDEVQLTGNLIDSISSDNVADTNVPIYMEGMTRVGDVLTFVAQTVYTDASDGRTRVALPTPLSDQTRMRGVTQGNVYAYENTALSGGVPVDGTKIHNQLVAGENTSLKAATSTQSTNYLVITGMWASIGKASGTNVVDVRFKIANLGSPILGDEFYTQEPWSVGVGQQPIGPPMTPYLIVPPNSRVLMTASASGGTIKVNAGFTGYFGDIVSR